MAHAFADGSVGLWVVNPVNLPARLGRIASFAGGMFTDVFVPETATPAAMALIRSTVRPNGTKLRAQLWTHPAARSPAEYGSAILVSILTLRPGVVELDIEVPDDILTAYIDTTLNRLRDTRPTFLFRVNIAPNKAVFLPAHRFATDDALFACEQTYYGDMSRFSEADALADLLGYGVPLSKASVCYGAAAPDPTTGERHASLPSVFYQGQPIAKLKRGLVFQDDLMADAGLL